MYASLDKYFLAISIADQRMHSVQVEVQYVYVAEALCEYGKAMGYWNDPELLQVSPRVIECLLLFAYCLSNLN